MPVDQTLRALVTARLNAAVTAAAEDIFELFEKTIAEYEEKLCRFEEQLPRKVNLGIELVRQHNQSSATSSSPRPGLNQDQDQIKDEPDELSFKQEEEELPGFVLDFSTVCVKTEESSPLQQEQTEHSEERQIEDHSSEPHNHWDPEEHTENLDDDHWGFPFTCSSAQVAIESDEDQNNQVQTRAAQNSCLFHKNTSALETSACNLGDMSGPEGRKHKCPFCEKRFHSNKDLQRHIRVHTGERPYSCLLCNKDFKDKSNLKRHMKTHTNEKPHRCSLCKKAFTQRSDLHVHMRSHTGEKPYSCPVCNRAFTENTNLRTHMRTHTGEKPFSCSLCTKRFNQNGHLKAHMRSHTGEKPHRCPVCNKEFRWSANLNKHMRGQHLAKVEVD